MSAAYQADGPSIGRHVTTSAAFASIAIASTAVLAVVCDTVCEDAMTDARRLRPLDPSVSPRFGDVATLLRAPRVPLGAGIDISLVGVPFDLGTNFRTG